jgi:hypothetical protein
VETGADLDRLAADVLGPRDAYLTFVESRPEVHQPPQHTQDQSTVGVLSPDVVHRGTV